MSGPERLPLIVLRFRDININVGETLREHLRIISEFGYCWWGWLFRGYERNPHQDLNELDLARRPESKGSPYDIALYDTGQGRIYRATCLEIRTWEIPLYSPQVDYTPSYYRDRRAPAWFRLSDIVEASPSLVTGRICVAMPSATPDCYVDLLDKPVERIQDLRRQEVTLWVLR